MSDAVGEIGPDTADAPLVVMYESHWCGYCRAARRLIESKGWSIDGRLVDGNAALRQEMTGKAGRSSVPQIWFGATHVGGYDELASLDADGELDALYADAARAVDGDRAI